MILAGDPAVEVNGACSVALVDDAAGRRLRFGRPVASPVTGYHWDNPGATLRFASAAGRITARLRYSEGHVSRTARNGTGLILVDGFWRPEWGFAHPAGGVSRDVRHIDVALPTPGDGAMHDYELVMPYGDSVEFCGLDADAAIISPKPRLRARWVAYGDSVTQGFDASHVGTTYAWLVAQRRGWELLNLGIGGRCCTPDDAEAIAGCAADLITVAIGVNDWQCGTAPATYGSRLANLLSRLRAAAPAVRIAAITPLWVGPDWKPQQACAPLADYRTAAAAAAQGLDVESIDGAGLIDHDPGMFNQVAVHPNDNGFAQMAGRLADRLFPDPQVRPRGHA